MEPLCIGVDVGGTNLRCALVTRGGVVLARESCHTEAASGLQPFLSRLLHSLERLKRGGEAQGLQVCAVGVGVPGLVSEDGVIHASVNFAALQGVDLAREVARETGLRAFALNDANANALAEQRFGAARPYRSSLMLTIGTGVGAGLILDGRLWTGIDGAAGEFGHITVEPDGRPCGCGNRGCLEQYVSATAIASGVAGGHLERDEFGAAAVAARARRGDPACAAVFERAGSYLGIAAAGVVNLLNLEAIVLGGGVARSFDLLLPAMHRELAARSFAIPGSRVRILQGELGDDAGIVGAAAFAFDALDAPVTPLRSPN